MLSAVRYQDLQDFNGLHAVREILARGDSGFIINSLPHLFEQDRLTTLQNVKIQKVDLATSSSPSLDTIARTMESLHELSHTVFKNISHGVELPWEKYLGEMHEFAAPGKDELQVIPWGEPIENKWSTLTLAVNSSSIDKALVLFGAALSVFTEGTTPEPTGREIDEELLPTVSKDAGSQWLVYYVRPNQDVIYTRTAGALMTPLSTKEYESRERVKDLEGVL
ncbi:hypothetical protein B0J13DRAFT_553443 [Dactylonectria estremocensis]|uniref:Uncharacterized protein n=1 Tax=Dactylonectria estremocensis TaxID=1079267 RepID=A0A9P9EUK7_9HYPO|nr:hypothetical protein B0J13DRAFT_553443 [Dactylonectria estremocensis]